MMDVLVVLVALLLVRLRIILFFFFLRERLRIILKREMLCLSIFSQQIFCSLLLLIDKKNNFSSVFKLELIIIYFIKFVIKIM